MENKDALIAQVALSQFSKYGLRKTTMQDVADAAKISRQTLYNRFPNKDELLRHVAQYYFNDNIQRCQEALTEKSNLSDVLDILIDHFVIEAWHTVHSMPDAEEFEMSTNDIIEDEVKVAVKQKSQLITEVLLKHCNETKLKSQEAYDIARFFCATAAGIKISAEHPDELKSLTNVLKQTLLTQLTK